MVARNPGLRVVDLTVRFGGAVAVKDFSLEAPFGRVTGLIGPNGAGKTTTFNACSGLLRPSSGRIELHGTDVTGIRPAGRARRGIGRSFQRMELFDSMTVRENVLLGRESSMAGARPWKHILTTPQERSELAEAVDASVDLCGIRTLLDAPVGGLSTGQRRLVELARCLTGPFDVLLLDEPSSGLNRGETARFGQVIQSVVAERGVAILLIEHDMELVMDTCEYIYVLDFGVPIFEGPPVDVASSPLVRAAYLGSEAVVSADVPGGVGS
jgi:ABC-type branched-subunit amino acid transport system ATPase component